MEIVVDRAAQSRRRLRGFRQERQPGEPRPFTHKVRVSEADEELLQRLAEQRGISIPRLLVESAKAGGAEAAKVSAESRQVLGEELFRVTRLMGKIGVNVNQIAAAANATGQVDEERLAAVVDALDRTRERVDLLLGRVSGQAGR